MSKKLDAPIPRYSLTPAEAAASLGVGEDLFNEQIRPALKVARVGRKVLIPVADPERWLRENAEAVFAERTNA